MRFGWLALTIVLLVPLPQATGAPASRTIDLATAGAPRIDGPSGATGFGTGALAVGDVNGDGAPDFVIGAPAASQSRGALYCIFGRSGELPASRDLATSAADLTIVGPAPGSRFGVAAVVADLDGDGAGELVCSSGAYIPAFGRLSSGGALVFRGGAALAERHVIDLATEHADAAVVDSTIPVPVGAALAVGDFNHDRFDDVAIGSPFSPGLDAQIHAGRVFVLPGRDDFPAGEVIEATTDARILTAVGSGAEDQAGSHLAAADVNDDLLDDLVIGMPTSTVLRAVTFEEAGKVAVVSGADLREFDPVELRSESLLLVLGSDFGDYFGFGIATGDVTGDGRIDVVGAAIDGDGEMNRRYPDCGEVFTIEGAATGAPRTVDLYQDEPWMRVIGDAPRRFLGGGLGAGDMDGDRRSEIVASSKSSPGPHGNESGIVYVLDGEMATVDLAAEPAVETIVGPSPQSSLGAELVLADLNGDGVKDVVATAPGALGGRGSVYVVAGTRTTPDAAPAIEPVPDVRLGPGQTASLVVRASDSDGDRIRFSISGRPPGSTFLDSGLGEAGFVIGPLAPGADHQVRIGANDGQLSSFVTVRVTYASVPTPVIAKAVYKNGALRLTGENFSATATVTVNGRAIGRPVTFNAARGRLRIVATSGQLGLLPGAGTNVVTVTVSDSESAPFSF